MPSLLIADDHPLFRAALRGAAKDAVPDLEVREADSLDSVLARLDEEPGIDLVLLDLHMPGNHGLAGLAAIRAQHPGVAVVVVSANDDPREAIRSVLALEQWLPPKLRTAVDGAPSTPNDAALAARLASLSPQQFRVLALVAEGLLNKQIADRLGVQERTVKAHLTAIFERLGVRNRTQASVILRELELSDPSKQMA